MTEETTPEREGSQDRTGPATERGHGGREGQPGTNPAAAHQAGRAQALNQGSAGRGQPSAQRPQQQAVPSCFRFLSFGQLFFVTQGETFGGCMRPEIIGVLRVFLQATSLWTILRKYVHILDNLLAGRTENFVLCFPHISVYPRDMLWRFYTCLFSVH